MEQAGVPPSHYGTNLIVGNQTFSWPEARGARVRYWHRTGRAPTLDFRRRQGTQALEPARRFDRPSGPGSPRGGEEQSCSPLGNSGRSMLLGEKARRSGTLRRTVASSMSPGIPDPAKRSSSNLPDPSAQPLDVAWCLRGVVSRARPLSWTSLHLSQRIQNEWTSGPYDDDVQGLPQWSEVPFV